MTTLIPVGPIAMAVARGLATAIPSGWVLLGGLAMVGCSAVGMEVANRTPLPYCGSEVTTRDSGFNIEGRRCFWDAYLAGQPAEFSSTRPSVEGDPITTIYRVLSPGHVEVFVDSTKDRFGSGTWEKYTCRSLHRVQGGLVEPDFGRDESCVESTPR